MALTRLRHGGLLLVLLGSFAVLQLVSCDDDTEDEAPLNLAGSWELTTTVTSNTCGLENGETATEIIHLSGGSDVLSITTSSGTWGTGEVDGQSLHVVGTETSDDFGCSATLVTEGTGWISQTEVAGTLTTTVSFADSCTNNPDCTMTTGFVMTRLAESLCLDRASFGDPEESSYILPYPIGASYPVYQSYCWPTGGHRDQLAYDFAIPIGDTVVVARAGVVREVREDSPDNGQGVGEHNYVHIEHEDGTLAFYAHLMQYSVSVDPGDTLGAGQPFARSGNSGESGEPHLHLGVYEEYPPVEGYDVPVNFRNAEGPLDSRGGLIRGEVYTATPY
jgi:hypothetical protein